MLTCTVMFHQYYEDTRLPDLSPLKGNNFNVSLYVNRVLIKDAGKNDGAESGMVIRYSPNCGKDIGGKMVLIDSFLRRGDQSDWVVFLHDKKSLQKITGSVWRDKLWTIIDGNFVSRFLETIRLYPDSGMIGPQSCKMNWANTSTDSQGIIQLVDNLSTDYGIGKSDFSFVAGTMFWIKADLLRNFFGKYSPLDIRATLEKGNVDDSETPTITHAWERLFARLVVSSGMKIRFI